LLVVLPSLFMKKRIKLMMMQQEEEMIEAFF
jgi:hypothetical protein